MDTTKFIPFNLERALAGDPVISFNGKRVTKLLHFAEIKMIALHVEGANVVETLTETGHLPHSADPHPKIFMAAKPSRTVWVNLFIYANAESVEGPYDTECMADERASRKLNRRLGGRAYPIEIEE